MVRHWLATTDIYTLHSAQIRKSLLFSLYHHHPESIILARRSCLTIQLKVDTCSCLSKYKLPRIIAWDLRWIQFHCHFPWRESFLLVSHCKIWPETNLFAINNSLLWVKQISKTQIGVLINNTRFNNTFRV